MAASDGSKKQAKYDQKSGVTSVAGEWSAAHGGMPGKKSVEEIEKNAAPKNYSGSVLRKS
jgi:predicted NAD/FAD-dependent oxidoreductase